MEAASAYDTDIHLTGEDLRRYVRSGQFQGQTAGQAPDHLQGNVVILPLRYAPDFLLYCLNNPKPCPLLHMSRPGEAALDALGSIDIRTDVPRYRIFREGRQDDVVNDISSLWQNDMVTFVLGCSFTFEEALMRQGYDIRHVRQGSNVPMFKTSIETLPGGVFSGPLVVTMRPFKPDDIPKVFDISSRYPHAHGTPIFWGDPGFLGISDLSKPDYGDAVGVEEGEVPVFWACGVTPQAAIAQAKPELCITHAPGCMLVTDLMSDQIPGPVITMQSLHNQDAQVMQWEV